MSIEKSKSEASNEKVPKIPMTLIINASMEVAKSLEEKLNESDDDSIRPIRVIGKIALIDTSNHPSAQLRNK